MRKNSDNKVDHNKTFDMKKTDGTPVSVSSLPAKNSIVTGNVSSLRRITSVLSIRTPTSVVMKCTQMGITRALVDHTGDRDILFQDFFTVDTYFFPSTGSDFNRTPKHPYSDFKFKDYSPSAFRFFRQAYSINDKEYLKSLCEEDLKELSASGQSGSVFFKSYDDVYVLKSLDSREAKFLRQLLAGYFINIKQNLNTLLPKYFGFYVYSSLRQKFRMCVMNNLLPSTLKLTEVYDLKGSTHHRRANSKELAKSCPTLKDLDFMARRPNGFLLPKEYRDLVLQTLDRDTRVLEGFKIMDYSLLIGVHSISQHSEKCPCGNISIAVMYGQDESIQNLSYELRGLVIHKDINKSINYQGGIPATDHSGAKYLIFIGIIDILQDYRFAKRLEHNFKAFIGDGKTVSVNNPTYYKERFLQFLEENVFLELKEGQIIIPPEITSLHINSSPYNTKHPTIPEDATEITLNNPGTEVEQTDNSENRKTIEFKDNNTTQDISNSDIYNE